MNWVDVEPQQGVFNWAPADNEAAAWAAAGKRFTLIVKYINEGTSGTDCSSPQLIPSWEIARIPSFCDTDMGTLIPDYFDPTFTADLQAYVQAIARHFAASPYRNNLLYARIAVGLLHRAWGLDSKGCNSEPVHQFFSNFVSSIPGCIFNIKRSRL